MDYYLCKTPTGPQLADTQLNARGLDRKFTEFKVDTAKKPLMEFINKLLDGTHELSPSAPITIAATLTPELSEDVQKWADEAPAPKIIYRDNPANERRQRLVATSDDLTAVQTFIENLPPEHEYVLDRLQEHINIRRGELLDASIKAAAATPVPPKRKRA